MSVKKYAKHLIKTRKLYQLQSRHIIMALSLFGVSTADSEGVLGVFSGSDSWYILLLVTTHLTVHTAVSHHTPHGTYCC
jgi:hypothetical protein